MKAYLIDPWTRTITAVEYSGDYQEIYQHIGASCFDCARFADNGDGVFIDDEGLLKNGEQSFFAIWGYPQPLAGKGLVLGCDADGESVEPQISLEELRARVRFLGEVMLNQ